MVGSHRILSGTLNFSCLPHAFDKLISAGQSTSHRNRILHCSFSLVLIRLETISSRCLFCLFSSSLIPRLTEINEWKYFFLVQLHISLLNNMYVWYPYTRRMICVFGYTNHLIVRHVVHVILYFHFTFFLQQDQTSRVKYHSASGNFHTDPVTGGRISN